MRKFLNGLYSVSLYASGALIVLICLLVSAQVFLNVATRFLPFDLPPSIPSYAEISGFMLAAASFCALGPTLKSGQHIQITLLTQHLAEKFAPIQKIAVYVIGFGFALYALYFVSGLVFESWEFGDKSFGSVKIDLWIPQSAMVLGLGVLAIALADELIGAIAQLFQNVDGETFND